MPRLAGYPALLIVLALPACAGQQQARPEPPPVRGSCRGEAGQAFVGKQATADVGEALLHATGARTLRWAPPRTAITMDYRFDRLTVAYDDAMTVTRVSCG